MTKHQGENRRCGKSQNLILTWCFFSYVDNGQSPFGFLVLPEFYKSSGIRMAVKVRQKGRKKKRG